MSAPYLISRRQLTASVNKQTLLIWNDHLKCGDCRILRLLVDQQLTVGLTGYVMLAESALQRSCCKGIQAFWRQALRIVS